MSVVANVAINVDSRGATQKLREVQVGAKATEQAFNALTQAAAAFGVSFAISKVIQDIRELDTNLKRLGTVGGDVTALDKGLGQLSRNLDGIANKAELAAASYQALSAGFTETGANLKVIEAATKAAIGGLANTTQVTEVLTKTLNAYGLSGNEAIKVTDSISKAIEYGQVEWADYTSQLGRVASIAAIAGVSIDEVNAFIAAATKNGATAEIAFTGLGATLNTILQPTKESQEAAKLLGIQWNIAGLNAKGFDGLIAELAKKMNGNKEAAVRLLGSQEAMRGAFAAASKNGKDFAAALASIQDATGKTNKDFDEMKNSLENKLKALDTAFKNLSEAIGKAFGPTILQTIKNVADSLNVFADLINAIPQPVSNFIAQIIKAVTVMALLQKAIEGIIALRASFVIAMTSMAATTTAIGTAATGSASATALYTNNTKALQAAAVGAMPALTGLRIALQNLLKIGIITIGVNLVIFGLQEFINAQSELDRLRGISKAGGAAATFSGSASEESKKIARQTLAAIDKEREEIRLVQAASSISGPGNLQKNMRLKILSLREKDARAILGLPTRQDKPENPPPRSEQIDTPAPGKHSLKDLIGADLAKARSETSISRLEIELEEKRLIALKDGNQELAKQLANQKQLIRPTEEIKVLQEAIDFVIKNRNGYLEKGKSIEQINRAIAVYRQQIQVRENELKLKALAFNQEEAEAKLESLKTGKELTVELQRQKDALKASSDIEQRILDINNKYIDNQNKIDKLLDEKQRKELTALNNEIKAAELQKQTKLGQDRMQPLEDELAILKARLNGNEAEVILKMQLRDIMANTIGLQETSVLNTLKDINATKALLAEKEKIANVVKDIGSSIATGIIGAIDGAITGAKTLQESLSDILKDIGKMLISFGIKSLLKATNIEIGGNKLFSFADGGIPPVGRPSLVGERGPELFVPRTAGTIIPTDTTAVAMARYQRRSNNGNNIGSNSGAEGDMALTPVLSMSFETTRFLGQDYVSTEQLQAAMIATEKRAAAAGAKAGAAQITTKLQQSPSYRRQVGLK
jgi:TP901 family phage tail tape measure protein